MQTELDNRPDPEKGSLAWAMKYYFGRNKIKQQEKGKTMTDFDIKETVQQIGYVDKDGKFVAETDKSKVQSGPTGTVFIQSNEDTVE